jgi:hypothetical protein
MHTIRGTAVRETLPYCPNCNKQLGRDCRCQRTHSPAELKEAREIARLIEDVIRLTHPAEVEKIRARNRVALNVLVYIGIASLVLSARLFYCALLGGRLPFGWGMPILCLVTGVATVTIGRCKWFHKNIRIGNIHIKLD